jgi:hypothetical protein
MEVGGCQQKNSSKWTRRDDFILSDVFDRLAKSVRVDCGDLEKVLPELG